MATKDPDLLKPSIYALIVGGIATVIMAFPIGAVTIWMGGQDLGKILLFVLGALTLFVQYAISYIFAGMTVRLVHDYLTQGDGRMDQAWATVRRDLFDILTLAGNPIGEMLAGALNALWTVATYFVLPAMIIEDLDLGKALKRATQIIKDNLLLVAVTEIGVGTVVGLIGFLLFLLAVALGGGLFYLIGALAQWSTAGIVIGIVAGVLLAGVIIIVVTVLSSYVTTAYHTCLFLWARQVEQARARGVADASVAAPAPLAGLV
jgi:hypothetical protein